MSKLLFDKFKDSDKSILSKKFKGCIKATKYFYKINDIDSVVASLHTISVNKHIENIEKFIAVASTKIDSSYEFELDLDFIEMYIKLLKMVYEYGYTNIITDYYYDRMILEFKRHRDEPVECVSVKTNNSYTDTEHTYKFLKGTLDKCHSILDGDSIYEFLLSSTVKSKSFISYEKYMLKLRLSLKYDGVSCVFDIDKDGNVVSAVTRGKDDKGLDITRMFRHIKYQNNFGCNIGLQTELMMTKDDIKKYSEDKDYEYDNSRIAVTSILRTLSWDKYSKYITPVPVNGYIPNENRYMTEKELIKFERGIPYIYTIFMGTLNTAMYEIVKYIGQLEMERPSMKFEIDGIVIDILDNDIRQAVGRKNNINKYQIAYKFKSEEMYTKVTGITFSVGRTGLVVPKIHFEKIKFFNGVEQTCATLSSKKRMEEQCIRLGDVCEIIYSNDVIPYFKGIIEPNLDEDIIMFPKRCPCCNSVLVDIDANSFCKNNKCPSRLIEAFSNCLKVLGVKDVSNSTVETLINNKIIISFSDMFKPDRIDSDRMLDIVGIGESKTTNLISQLKRITEQPIHIDKLLCSLGVSGLKTCTLIMQEISIDKLMNDPEYLYEIEIPTVGQLKKDKFLQRINSVNDELFEIMRTCNVIDIKKAEIKDVKMRICFTGFRDSELKKDIEDRGGLVVDTLKNVDMLLIPNYSYTSSKTKQAEKKAINIMDEQEFRNVIDKLLK